MSEKMIDSLPKRSKKGVEKAIEDFWKARDKEDLQAEAKDNDKAEDSAKSSQEEGNQGQKRRKGAAKSIVKSRRRFSNPPKGPKSEEARQKLLAEAELKKVAAVKAAVNNFWKNSDTWERYPQIEGYAELAEKINRRTEEKQKKNQPKKLKAKLLKAKAAPQAHGSLAQSSKTLSNQEGITKEGATKDLQSPKELKEVGSERIFPLSELPSLADFKNQNRRIGSAREGDKKRSSSDSSSAQEPSSRSKSGSIFDKLAAHLDLKREQDNKKPLSTSLFNNEAGPSKSEAKKATKTITFEWSETESSTSAREALKSLSSAPRYIRRARVGDKDSILDFHTPQETPVEPQPRESVKASDETKEFLDELNQKYFVYIDDQASDEDDEEDLISYQDEPLHYYTTKPESESSPAKGQVASAQEPKQAEEEGEEVDEDDDDDYDDDEKEDLDFDEELEEDDEILSPVDNSPQPRFNPETLIADFLKYIHNLVLNDQEGDDDDEEEDGEERPKKPSRSLAASDSKPKKAPPTSPGTRLDNLFGLFDDKDDEDDE
jgi:hypothetical protein